MNDPVRQTIAHYWDGRALNYDAVGLHTPETEAELRAWARIRALLAPGDRLIDVLDVGCGTGFLSLLFAQAGNRVTGCDLAQAMIEQARHKAATFQLPVSFIVGDAETLAAPDQSFDLVASRQLFWTLPRPEQALREWTRVTRSGGRIAIIDDQWNPGPRGGGASDPYERELVGALPYLNGGIAAEDVYALIANPGSPSASCRG